MLAHPTLNHLSAMGLHGMAKAFADLAERADADGLSHGEWLALLLEREASHRQDKRLSARLRHARLRHMATPEDINWMRRVPAKSNRNGRPLSDVVLCGELLRPPGSSTPERQL